MQDCTAALAGIRVIDASRVLSGPYCAMILADLGAEVIKMEGPDGDDSRFFGPFVGADSAYFRYLNRNKYGVRLDLRAPEDRDRFRGLLARSDVLVHNFRPANLARSDLSIDDLRQANPRLVIASVTGFGHVGPNAELPAYDLIAQALSGIMSVTGAPGGEPTRCGVSLGDLIPGLHAAIGVLAALHERERTGAGQHVDVAMVDCLIGSLESVALRALYEPDVPAAEGNHHAMTAPFGTFQAADGLIAIAVSNDRLFAQLAHAVDRPQWLTDPALAHYANRSGTGRERIRAELARVLATDSVEHWVERLRSHGVPAAPVLDVTAALTQQQAAERGLIVTEPDGFRSLASPVRLTGSVPPRSAPRLGEHDRLLEEWLREPERTGAPAPSGEREGARRWTSD